MRARIEFLYNPDNQDEAQSIQDMQNGIQYKIILLEIDNMMRAKLKYDDTLSQDAVTHLQEVRDLLYSELKERNLDIL